VADRRRPRASPSAYVGERRVAAVESIRAFGLEAKQRVAVLSSRTVGVVGFGVGLVETVPRFAEKAPHGVVQGGAVVQGRAVGVRAPQV